MKGRRICQLSLVLAGLLFMLILIWDRTEEAKSQKTLSEGDYLTLTGHIYNIQEKEHTVQIYLDQLDLYPKEKVLVSIKKEESKEVQIGQRVSASGRVAFFLDPPNPGNFDSRSYYRLQNIYFKLNHGTIREVYGEKGWLLDVLYKCRKKAQKRIDANMEKEYGELLSAMLLGETQATQLQTKEVFQKAGIGHLLAISGLHISFFGLGIYQILRRIKVPCPYAAGVSGLLILLYVLMTGSKVSAIRAAIMCILRMCADLSGREYDSPTALAISASVLLIVSPLQMTQAGFLLSFGAIIGSYLSIYLKKKKQDLLAAAGIYLVTIPILLWFYYEISPYSILWNVPVVFLSSALFLVGLMGICTGFPVFFRIAQSILIFYKKGSQFLLFLPGGKVITGRPEVWKLIWYYLVLLGILFLIQKQRKKVGWIVVALIIGMLAPPSYERNLEITMLDVGQGDCFFVRTPSGITHLIDGGSSDVNEVGKYRIESFLKYQGIQKIDYVWISHGDTDHVNGIMEMLTRQLEGIPIRHLMLPPKTLWEEKLQTMENMAKRHNIICQEIAQGDVFKEEEVTWRCLWPKEGTKGDPNEGSVVLSLTYGSFDMLFTGDLEHESEQRLCDWMEKEQRRGRLTKEFEVLKVAHHGSKNGTSDRLLELIQPECAWISAGKNNRYGHPHREVVQRLANHGISRYNTKDENAVKLYTDGKKYCILLP